MLENQNSFGLREARLVWKNEGLNNPAYSVGRMAVGGMAEQIDAHVKEKGITLTEADRAKLENYKQEKGKIIFWSARERQKFVGEIGATNNDAGNLGALIEHEIQTEIFEKKMDTHAKDYEGHDESDALKDTNSVRQIIETAYDTHTRGLTTEQRNTLDQAILQKIGHAHDHGEHINFGVLKDLMITEKEAEEIATFIKNEANKIKQENKTKPTTPQEWKKQMEESEAKLKAGFTKPEWCKSDATINNDVKEAVQEKKAENQKAIKDFASVGITTTLENLETGLSTILSSAHEKNGIIGKNTTKALGETIKARGDALLKWATERYPKNSAEVVDKILTSKKIDKNNIQTVLEYLAFGNVEDDMKAAENYFEAKNKSETDETKKIETNEAIKAPDAKSETEKETEAKGFDSVKKDFDAFMGAVNKGDWGEAFSEFFKMIGSFFKFAGSFILGAIPASAEGIPFIGEKIVKPLREWAKSSGGEDKKTEKEGVESSDQTATTEQPKTKEEIAVKADENLKKFGLGEKVRDAIKDKTVNEVIVMPTDDFNSPWTGWFPLIDSHTDDGDRLNNFQRALETLYPNKKTTNVNELIAGLSKIELDTLLEYKSGKPAEKSQPPATPKAEEKPAEEPKK